LGVPFDACRARELFQKAFDVEAVVALDELQQRAAGLDARDSATVELERHWITELEAIALGPIQDVRDAIPPKNAPLRNVARGDEKCRLHRLRNENRQSPLVALAIAVIEGDDQGIRRQRAATHEIPELMNPDRREIAANDRHLTREFTRRRVDHARVERLAVGILVNAMIGEHGK